MLATGRQKRFSSQSLKLTEKSIGTSGCTRQGCSPFKSGIGHMLGGQSGLLQSCPCPGCHQALGGCCTGTTGLGRVAFTLFLKAVGSQMCCSWRRRDAGFRCRSASCSRHAMQEGGCTCNGLSLEETALKVPLECKECLAVLSYGSWMLILRRCCCYTCHCTAI